MSKPPSHSKPVSLVMKSRNSDLQQLFQKMHEINRLKKCFMPFLEEIVKPYVDISYDFKHTLIIIVANDAIATRIRFQIPDLLQRCAPHPYLNIIKHIQVKIQSHKHSRKNAPTSQRAVALLSEESAESVQFLAESIKHPALKTVMQRIARRKKQTT